MSTLALEIAEKQIISQLESIIDLKITFLNERAKYSSKCIDYISIYDQNGYEIHSQRDDNYFISIPFFRSKRLTKQQYEKLLSLTENNDDVFENFGWIKQIFWNKSYDEFYDEFYNKN